MSKLYYLLEGEALVGLCYVLNVDGYQSVINVMLI